MIKERKGKGWPVYGIGKKKKIKQKKGKGPENNEEKIPHQRLQKNYIRKWVVRLFFKEKIKKKKVTGMWN